MFKKHFFAAALAAPLAFAASSGAYGADLLFLKNSPAAKFGQADFKLLRQSVDSALSGPPDGPVQTWKNDKTGASGTVTPEGVQPASAGAGKPARECRRLRIANAYKLTKDEGVYTFCRSASGGQWQLRP
ncbi:hypothetical protein [Variovorax sp.]|uniref:hypothetical protein n=1 Tax=Variovorax sp. TaxID=1871043 RepID=UPI002D664F51|nr:hypothetical protein [Variovorax sp.]HYP83972.1 hypothetical protein [Variovorax sp.]